MICNTCSQDLSLSQFYDTTKSKRCKPCTAARQKKAYDSSTTLRSGIMLRNRKKLVQRYGLTWEAFVARWEKQEGKCAICAVAVDTFALASASTAACIDHNHATGEVRGILCRCCNLALGYMKDSPANLRQAITYLESKT